MTGRHARVVRRLRAAILDTLIGVPPSAYARDNVTINRVLEIEVLARRPDATRAGLLAGLVDLLGGMDAAGLRNLTGLPIERAEQIVSIAEGDDFGTAEVSYRWATAPSAEAVREPGDA